MKKILTVAMILSLSLTFLVISIEQNAFNRNYYMNSFKKNNIELETGKSMDELLEISDDIISYLDNKGGNELLGPYFNQREILHMVDVQNLFKLGKLIKYAGLAVYLIALLYFHFKKEYTLIGKIFFLGPIFNYILFITLGLLASINFNKYFTYFHKIFFKNDLWLLDPNTDLMIQMLPENFFMGMAKNILLFFFIYMVILQIVGFLYIRKGKKHDEIQSNKRGSRKNKKILNKK